MGLGASLRVICIPGLDAAAVGLERRLVQTGGCVLRIVFAVRSCRRFDFWCLAHLCRSGCADGVMLRLEQLLVPSWSGSFRVLCRALDKAVTSASGLAFRWINTGGWV